MTVRMSVRRDPGPRKGAGGIRCLRGAEWQLLQCVRLGAAQHTKMSNQHARMSGMSSQIDKRHRTGCCRSPVQTLPHCRLLLHDGGALIFWPGMLFPSSRGYYSYGEHQPLCVRLGAAQQARMLAAGGLESVALIRTCRDRAVNTTIRVDENNERDSYVT